MGPLRCGSREGTPGIPTPKLPLTFHSRACASGDHFLSAGCTVPGAASPERGFSPHPHLPILGKTVPAVGHSNAPYSLDLTISVTPGAEPSGDSIRLSSLRGKLSLVFLSNLVFQSSFRSPNPCVCSNSPPPILRMASVFAAPRYRASPLFTTKPLWTESQLGLKTENELGPS